MVRAPSKSKSKSKKVGLAFNRRKGRPPDIMSFELAAEPMHEYAEDIVSGKIKAGKFMIKAAERHLRDAARKDIYWDGEEAKRVVEFFTTHLQVSAGDGSGEIPFELLPWQQFLLLSLFCWKMKRNRKKDFLEREPDTRRFRRLYIESAKGNGKTPLVVGILLYLFLTSKDRKNDIFICGDTIEEAEVPLEEILLFCQNMAKSKHINGYFEANELGGRKKVPGSSVVWHKSDGRLKFYDKDKFNRSNIRLVSAGKGRGNKKTGLSGLRVTAALVTELHEFTSSKSLDMLAMSVKGMPEPLIMVDTNAGNEKEGPCWDEREAAINALESEPGKMGDDRLTLIFGVDENDKPFDDRKCWIKANPSLGAPFMKVANIIPQIHSAVTPSKKAYVLRLHFGVWNDSLLLPFDSSIWAAAQFDVIKPHKDAKLFVGLDLAKEDAMAAITKCWAYKAPGAKTTEVEYWLETHYWWNEHALKARSEDWQDKFKNWISDYPDIIDLAPGGSINLDGMATYIANLAGEGQDGIAGLAYDPYKWIEIHKRLADAAINSHDALSKRLKRWSGIPLYMHPQTSQQFRNNPLWIGGSYEAFSQALARGQVKSKTNPILNFNVSCGCIAHDKLDNPYYTRPSGDKLIDGLISSTEAIGLADYLINPLEGEGGGF